MGRGVSIQGSATTTGAMPMVGGPSAIRCIGRRKNPSATEPARAPEISMTKIRALRLLAGLEGTSRTTRLLPVDILRSDLQGTKAAPLGAGATPNLLPAALVRNAALNAPHHSTRIGPEYDI